MPAGTTVALDDEGLLTCTDVQVKGPSSCVAPWSRPGAAARRTRRGLDGASDADRAPATMAERLCCYGTRTPGMPEGQPQVRFPLRRPSPAYACRSNRVARPRAQEHISV